MLMPGVGHCPQARKPVAVNLALRDFVERAARSPQAVASGKPREGGSAWLRLTQPSQTEAAPAVYQFEGTLLEACNCDVLCPCWIGEDPDNGTCQSVVAYHLDTGAIRGVDVSGLTLANVVFIPGNVLAGNWKALLYVDERASDEQLEALVDAFSGKLGGPLADLAQLIGEQLGVVRAPISHEVSRGARHAARRRRHRGGRDGALPGRRRQHHHAAELDLLDRARLAGVGREGVAVRGEHARSGLDVRVHGPQRDPVGMEDRLPRRGGVTVSRPAVPAAPALGAVPRPVLIGIGLSWAAAIAAEATGSAHAVHHDSLLVGGPGFGPALLLFLLAWQVMVGAMMLPSSLPLVRMYTAATVGTPERGRSLAAFVGGYALVWSAFGALAFSFDAGVHASVAASPWIKAHDWAIAPGVLLLAGAFQFSSLKDACLRACRHPGVVPAAALRARPASRPDAGPAPRGVLRGLLLGADAGDVRGRSGQPDLDGGPDGADGPREDTALGRPERAGDGRGAAGDRLDAAAVRGLRERGDLAAALHLARAGRSAAW